MRCAGVRLYRARRQEMGKHAEALTAALQQKLTLVEYFKSDNALLQNSLRYFTYRAEHRQTVQSGAKRRSNRAVSHVLVRFIHVGTRRGQGRGSAQSFVREPAHAARSRHANRTWLADCGDASSRRYPLAPDHRRPTTAVPMPSRMPCYNMPTVSKRARRPVSGAAVPRSRHPAWLFVLPVCATALECPGPAPGQYRLRDGGASRLSPPCAPAKNVSVPSQNQPMTPSFPPIAQNIVSWNASRRRSLATRRRNSRHSFHASDAHPLPWPTSPAL